MTLTNFSKKYIKPLLIITLLAVLVLTATGCEELGFPPIEPAEETAVEEEETPPPITITTEDRAILAVREHLLSQAESYQAKLYLADFYAISNEWSAESEFLKDGTSVWYVVAKITASETPEERPHWHQAHWLVFQDGKVMASHRFQANALRIEADLQELSVES
jgi:hypothetical protein